MQTPDRLQSDQVSLFTGKKDHRTHCIRCGTCSTKCLSEKNQPPSKVNVVYSDGKGPEEAVEWDTADYSRVSRVRCNKSHVQGRTVSSGWMWSAWNKSFSRKQIHRGQIAEEWQWIRCAISPLPMGPLLTMRVDQCVDLGSWSRRSIVHQVLAKATGLPRQWETNPSDTSDLGDVVRPKNLWFN